MEKSKRQVALNNFMYHTGLKARLRNMTCPSDVFIEICQQQININAIRSIEGLITETYKSDVRVKLQTWGGSIGLYLNDDIIENYLP